MTTQPTSTKRKDCTNTKGLSSFNRDADGEGEGEVERSREQLALLQRNTERDKELLHCKDKELHHWRGPSPAPSHSQGDECVVDDRNRKRDKRSPHPARNKSNLPIRRGQSLHLTTKVEGKSKTRRSSKDQFLNARQSLIPESLRCHRFLVMMP